VRALIWIVAITLGGAAALVFARQLAQRVPSAEPSKPATSPVEVAPTQGESSPELAMPARAESSLAPVAFDPGLDLVPGEPDAPSTEPLGLEDGGEPSATRPLPDFGPKYALYDARTRREAMDALAAEIRSTYGTLPFDLREDLNERLAHRPPPHPPAAQVRAMLSMIDEREWLRRNLGHIPDQER